MVSLSDEGYNLRSLEPGDELFIDLKDEENTAIIFMENGGSIKTTIETCFSDGMCYKREEINEFGVHILGKNASLTFRDKMKLITWIVPSQICSGKSLLYSTNYMLSDSFVLKGKEKSICIFFSFYDSINSFVCSKDDKLIKGQIDIYTADSLPNMDSHCLGETCSHELGKPFFVEFTNISSQAKVDFNFAMKNNHSSEINCSRNGIIIMNRDSIIIDDIFAEKSHVTCQSNNENNYSKAIFGLLIAILVVFILLLCINGIISKTLCGKSMAMAYQEVDENDIHDRIGVSKTKNDGGKLIGEKEFAVDI